MLPVAVVLGAAAAAVPGLAAGNSASFTAVDFAWTANGSARSTRVTIVPGGSVGFSYPTGQSEHNADFGNGPRPAGCAQTAGAPGGRVPPLPHLPTGAGWSGSCTFATPGIYRFHCDEHAFMTGTVVVQGPAGSPLAGRPANAISIRSRQRGIAVHGTVKLSQASRGGTLEIDLRATAKSLGRRGGGMVRVGRISKTALRPGTVHFAVPLGPAARRAERSRGRLPVAVSVTVAPPGRPSVSLSRPVVLLS